jgi:hypothetical protein
MPDQQNPHTRFGKRTASEETDRLFKPDREIGKL